MCKFPTKPWFQRGCLIVGEGIIYILYTYILWKNRNIKWSSARCHRAPFDRVLKIAAAGFIGIELRSPLCGSGSSIDSGLTLTLPGVERNKGSEQAWIVIASAGSISESYEHAFQWRTKMGALIFRFPQSERKKEPLGITYSNIFQNYPKIAKIIPTFAQHFPRMKKPFAIVW